jgi:hypothetical protein
LQKRYWFWTWTRIDLKFHLTKSCLRDPLHRRRARHCHILESCAD